MTFERFEELKRQQLYRYVAENYAYVQKKKPILLIFRSDNGIYVISKDYYDNFSKRDIKKFNNTKNCQFVEYVKSKDLLKEVKI